MTDDLPSVSATVTGAIEEIWRNWVDVDRLAKWFAEPSAPLDSARKAVRLDFGDGDFFLTDVLEAAAPEQLHLRWRTCGIGDPDLVSVHLSEIDDATTKVTVHDSGLRGPHGGGLREDWLGFLSRLRRYSDTGENARYDWSTSIELGFRLARAKETAPIEALRELAGAVATAAVRGGERVRLSDAEGASVRLQVDHSGDAGTTTAQLTHSFQGNRYLIIEHIGWETLGVPKEDQIAARRLWVERWLAVIEERGLARP